MRAIAEKREAVVRTLAAYAKLFREGTGRMPAFGAAYSDTSSGVAWSTSAR